MLGDATCEDCGGNTVPDVHQEGYGMAMGAGEKINGNCKVPVWRGDVNTIEGALRV